MAAEAEAAPSSATRVVVTGLGAVSGFGGGIAALWQESLAGRTAVRPLERFATDRHRTRIAAEVQDGVIEGLERCLGRADRYALLAAAEAAAGIERGLLASGRAGVFFGSSTGALLEGERYYEALLRGGRAALHTVASHQCNGPGDAVARAFGVRGPTVTCSTACTSANVALAAALDALRAGEVDVVLAGGADELCQLTYAGFNAVRAVDPAPARPFRRSRAGLSMGEGSGVLLLETDAHAARRGATVLAELAGAGRSCDAYHVSAPDPEGAGAAAAIRLALAAAGEPPAAVTFVNAHGTGTAHNDDAEARALHAVFGARALGLPIAASKSQVGHLLGAAGGIEAVLTVLSIAHRLLPPACGDEPADPALGLDVVLGAPRPLPERNVGVSTNLAFGGNNCAVVLRSWP